MKVFRVEIYNIGQCLPVDVDRIVNDLCECEPIDVVFDDFQHDF